VVSIPAKARKFTALLFCLLASTYFGSNAAAENRQSAEQVATIALKSYHAGDFQIAGRMYLQAYALSNSASTLWNAGKSFRAAAKQAFENQEIEKSVELRKEALETLNRLLKNHELPPKRLALTLEQIERLKIQIAEQEKRLAETPPPPAPPVATKIAPPPPPRKESVSVVSKPAAASKTGPWSLIVGGGALGIASASIYFFSESEYTELKSKVELDPTTNLIPMTYNREDLLKEEDQINLYRKVSLGLAIGAGVAVVAGSVWMSSIPDIVPSISATKDNTQLIFAGRF